MNKMIKGAIAGATGVALLMGGSGTYALWSDSQGLDGGTVQSGTLDIVSVGAASWADVSTDATSSTWQADYMMVPGDKVTMTRAVTIDAEGKNLAVDFALTGLPTGPYWGGNLAVTATYDGQALTGGADDNGTPADTSDDGHRFTTAAATPAQVDGVRNLVVTFEFDRNTSGVAQQDRSLSLSGLNLTVTQNRP